MMFLTSEQTGGPLIFALRQHNHYLAVWHRGWKFTDVRAFGIEQLAEALGQGAGETWQEDASLILLACMGGRLFEWLDAAEQGRRLPQPPPSSDRCDFKRGA